MIGKYGANAKFFSHSTHKILKGPIPSLKIEIKPGIKE